MTSSSGYAATDRFGPDVADAYDVDDGVFSAAVVDRTVDVLAELATAAGGTPGGAAFELAIGTGRIAVPLAARGVEVVGVDPSAAMLARLRAKPGAGSITAVEAGMTDVRLGREFDLVYLVFNTIGNVTTQDGQVAVFETAAAHLRPGGSFLVEVGVPDLQRLPFGERFRPFTVRPGYIGVDEYDVVEQGLVSHHCSDGGDGMRVRSIPFRYVWPAELDLMARLAGLRPAHRWGDWDRSPFTATSASHISVWTTPAGANG